MRKKTKKSVKVKKKIVKSKRKVRFLKSKKAIKSKKKKRVVKNAKKKKRKRKRRKKISMEDIYSILNKVQIARKRITFATDLIDAATIENTIKDAEIKYVKVEMKTQVVFTLKPSEEKYEDEKIIDLEIMDDEIPDVGQIFG